MNNMMPNFKLPTFDEDCELVDICKEIGATYNICYKGADFLSSKRCTPAQKQAILQGYAQKNMQLEIQNREDTRQAKEEKIQLLRDKQAVRRSWIQLLLAAILGGVFTKLIDCLPMIVDWLKSLLE